MSIGGTYEAETLGRAHRRRSSRRVGALRLRPDPRRAQWATGHVAGAMIFAVFRQAAHPKAAMRLIERAVTPAALAAAGSASGRAVTTLGVRWPWPAPTCRSCGTPGRSSSGMVTRPWIPLYSRVSTQLQAMIETVLTGGAGPAAAAQHTAAMIAAITGLPVVEPAAAKRS